MPCVDWTLIGQTVLSCDYKMACYQHLPVLVFWMALITAIQGTSTITMYLQPSEKLEPGSTVTISCAVNRDSTPLSLLWLRKQGTLTSKLASGDVLDKYLESSRYRMVFKTQQNWDNYTLTINNVKYEDTATIKCQLDGGQHSQSRTIAVCDHPSSHSCNCIHQEGFVYPGCFDEPDTVEETEDRYKGIVTGLAVCFVIVVIYAILVTVFLSRECVTKLYSRRQKLLEKVRKPKKGLANGLPPQRGPYQHAEQIDVDPSEAPAWSGGNNNVRHNAAAVQQHENPAFEIEDDEPLPQIHTPAILPSARSRVEYGEPGQLQRTVATVEHHHPPTPSSSAAAAGAQPSPPYASQGLEVPADHSTGRYSPSSYGAGARPRQPTAEVPPPGRQHPQPSPSSSRAPIPQDRFQYPSTSSPGYQYDYEAGAEGSRTPRSRGPPNPSANGRLPNDVTTGAHTPSGGHLAQHSQPSTPYDAGNHGNVTPRSIRSERLPSRSPNWDSDVTDRAAYTDIPRDKQGGGAPYRGAKGHHQGEPRKQLDFGGHHVTNNNNDNGDVFISKTDSVV